MSLSDLISEHSDLDPPESLSALWTETEAIWARHENRPAFNGFVSADYLEVYRALAGLRHRSNTFLEWGSGLGAVTLAASSLGYDAYGIEAEPELVERSRELSERFDLPAEFAAGNFIPSRYRWNPECGEESLRSWLDIEPGYDALEMDLRDFEVIYVFPWPDEQALLRDIVHRCADPDAMFLIYDVREGLTIHRAGDSPD